VLQAIRTIDETPVRKLQTKTQGENPRKHRAKKYTPTWKPREREQTTNQEHTNILWTYPVADRMIYYKKREPVHTYILYQKIQLNNQHRYRNNDIVTTYSYNTVDNIYAKHVNVWDPRAGTVTLQTNIVLAWRWLMWVETCSCKL